MLESYRKQLSAHRKLDIGATDDFNTWQKEKNKKLSELKNGVASKKKSLKRRAGDITQITSDLTDIGEEITAFMTLLKNLASGTVEGSCIYQGIFDTIPSDEIHEVSAPIWERALRAIAFED